MPCTVILLIMSPIAGVSSIAVVVLLPELTLSISPLFAFVKHSCYQARARSARARRACALRALGLLLADGTPTVGGGKTF